MAIKINFKSIGAAVLGFLKSIFKGETGVLEDATSQAVQLFQRAKMYTYNPSFTQAIDVIPGDWANKIIDKAAPALELVLEKTLQGQECLSKATFGEKLDCFLRMAESKPDSEKAKTFNRFVVDLTEELYNSFDQEKGKFDINKVFILVPAIWAQLFGKK